MTLNQIEYQKHLESVRSNLEREKETNRSNLAREAETQRANLANEAENVRYHDMTVSLGFAQLAESQRHNSALEFVSYGDLQERNRHNLASENLQLVDTAAKYSSSMHSTNTQADTAAKNLAAQQQQFKDRLNYDYTNSALNRALTIQENELNRKAQQQLQLDRLRQDMIIHKDNLGQRYFSDLLSSGTKILTTPKRNIIPSKRK